MPWWTIGAKVSRLVAPPLFLGLGVTLGGGLIGSLGESLASNLGPADPSQLAFKIRIWAVAVAIGGALTALENLEKSLSTRAMIDIARGGITLMSAYAGAQLGYWLILWWMHS